MRGLLGIAVLLLFAWAISEDRFRVPWRVVVAGVLLQFAAFTLLWQGHFWQRSLPAWRSLLSIALFTVASILSWTSSHALRGHLHEHL